MTHRSTTIFLCFWTSAIPNSPSAYAPAYFAKRKLYGLTSQHLETILMTIAVTTSVLLVCALFCVGTPNTGFPTFFCPI